MLKGFFDEVDDHDVVDDLEGYEEEVDQDELDEEEDEMYGNEKKSKKRLSFNDYEEDMDCDEKRRIMSVGMDLP